MARDELVGFSDAQNARFAEVVHAVQAADAALAAAQARMTRALADARELARDVAASSSAQARARDMAERTIASEIGAALRLSDSAVQRRMDAAAELASDYPRTLAALEAGTINAGHVRVITDAGAILPTESRAVFETHALAHCERRLPGGRSAPSRCSPSVCFPVPSPSDTLRRAGHAGCRSPLSATA